MTKQVSGMLWILNDRNNKKIYAWVKFYRFPWLMSILSSLQIRASRAFIVMEHNAGNVQHNGRFQNSPWVDPRAAELWTLPLSLRSKVSYMICSYWVIKHTTKVDVDKAIQTIVRLTHVVYTFDEWNIGWFWRELCSGRVFVDYTTACADKKFFTQTSDRSFQINNSR